MSKLMVFVWLLIGLSMSESTTEVSMKSGCRQHDNPIEWAWHDYRTATIILLVLSAISIGLNVFFCCVFYADECFIERKVVRLRPTDQDML